MYKYAKWYIVPIGNVSKNVIVLINFNILVSRLKPYFPEDYNKEKLEPCPGHVNKVFALIVRICTYSV